MKYGPKVPLFITLQKEHALAAAPLCTSLNTPCSIQAGQFPQPWMLQRPCQSRWTNSIVTICRVLIPFLLLCTVLEEKKKRMHFVNNNVIDISELASIGIWEPSSQPLPRAAPLGIEHAYSNHEICAIETSRKIQHAAGDAVSHQNRNFKFLSF